MAFRMTMGHPRPWPGYPHHTGLISAAMTDVIATCSSHPRFRHQLSSDPASRRAPLLRRMVPVITVHKGLPPLNAHHYSTHQARMPVLLEMCCVIVERTKEVHTWNRIAASSL